jgi:hypothetical protein
MNMRIKLDELISILIQKPHESMHLMRKYGLNDEKLARLRRSLKQGKWGFAD